MWGYSEGAGREEKGKRRASGKPTKPKGRVTKVAQRLLGPTSFTLDRMLAILGALLEENDVDSRSLLPNDEEELRVLSCPLPASFS